jgi:branched-chain amino acid transport system ATP-binding protein
MLSVQKLDVDVEGSRVLRGVSFEVKAGELVCLVGRNGAGKTTTFRTIMGFRQPAAGSITFEGIDLVGLRPYQVARLGVGFAPEESEVFGELTVAENIALPTWVHSSPSSAVARIEQAYRVFPQLDAYRARGGHALSGGERKMVSIARALALGPKLLLLDEPTEGLSPVVVPSIIQGLANIRAFGHALFIAESNIHHLPDFTDRLYVIERGEVIFAGRPEAAIDDPVVARVVAGTARPPQAADPIEEGPGDVIDV